MKLSTAIRLINLTISIGSIVAIGYLWSIWASVLIVTSNIAVPGLQAGAKSLEAGGE
jgi:hypothetical protein